MVFSDPFFGRTQFLDGRSFDSEKKAAGAARIMRISALKVI